MHKALGAGIRSRH